MSTKFVNKNNHHFFGHHINKGFVLLRLLNGKCVVKWVFLVAVLEGC